MWRHIVIAIMLELAGAGPLLAETLQSNSYKIDESFIGGGGLVESSSSSYRSSESIGDVGVGSSSSTNFQTESGYTTTGDPALTFLVNTSSINFGTLSTAIAATATSTFSIINYTSYGYTVQTLGSPPRNGSYVLPAMTTTGPSQPGTEQYGINVVRNNNFGGAGQDLGSDPVGGFGVAASGYNTAAEFKYVNGETIASAPKSSGQTDFTISYIANTTSTTPGGAYSGTQELVVVGTY